MICTRPQLLFSTLAVLLTAAACNSSKPTKPGPSIKAQALRVTSVPVGSAVVGEPLRYRVTTNVAGAEVRAARVPARAAVEPSGIVSWTPSDEQAGDQTLSLTVTAGDETLTHDFTVRAARARVEVTEQVDPQSAVTQTVAVRAPSSPARGAAVQIDPGSLAATAEQTITISSLEGAPVPPAARVARVAPAELTPIELGPSGVAFRTPARVQLPVREAIAARSQSQPPEVQTYDYGTGRWHKIKVLAWDKVQRLVIAEVNHFSTYVALPPLTLVTPLLARGADATACAGALVVRAPLAVPFADLPADVVNGAAGMSGSVAELLAALPVGQALQVYSHVEAHAAGAGVSGFLLASATRTAEGYRVQVASDRNAEGLLAIPETVKDATALEPFLNGSRAHVVLGGLGALAGGARATVDVSLYLVAAADAARPPAQAVNPLVTEEVQAEALAPIEAGFDEDCDGAPAAFDASPRGEAPPLLVAAPAGPLRVLVGAESTLAISADRQDLTFSWSGSDPALGLSAAGAGATIKPALPGTFDVTVVGTKGGASARYVWTVVADRPAAQSSNSAPAVEIAAGARVARVGEPVSLLAVGKDREQATLTYAWSTDARGAALSSATGGAVTFVADKPGDYIVRCSASDGLATSPPAALTVSVLAATENRPPGTPRISPLSAILTHAPGAPVSVTLEAAASDPDGDPITFEFAADASVPRTVALARTGNAATVTTTSDGVFTFYVTARDAKGAASPFAAVRVQVTPEVAPAAADGDKDGFAVGADCDDARADAYPGAKELCGDGVDQDCDGRDLAADACDADRDRYTAAGGDCDDRDSSRNPGAAERCDAVDNDCDGTADEDFGLDKACSAGEGACAAPGQATCNASATGVVCGAVPLPPGRELCDGVDNDCNGKIDDVAEVGNDVSSCGGCGLKCPAAAFVVASCVAGGCEGRCEAGHVDLDGKAENGCECAFTNGGAEACDGLDNDCNGRIDDGAAETYYPGPAGTQGVGQCTEGVRSCEAGQLVVVRPAQLPAAEACDGLDNDCNGVVDELASCRPTGGADGGVPPSPSGNGPGLPAICATTAGATCTDLATDPRNCGRCGAVCTSGVCTSGVCGTSAGGADAGAPVTRGEADDSCPESYPPDGVCKDPLPNGCQDPAGKPFCTSHAIDNANCGACGVACGAGTSCVKGVCAAPAPGCSVERPNACQAGGVSVCTNTEWDELNCGGCGTVCGAGMVCDFGRCQIDDEPAPTCQAPNVSCPDGRATHCTDPQRDPANCGACGRACALDNFCEAGVCKPKGGATPGICATPSSLCQGVRGDYCADLSRDHGNCGACGVACGADMHCQAAICVPGAPPPPICVGTQTLCKDAAGGQFCSDLMFDLRNCGACGAACPADMRCDAGKCSAGGSLSCVAPQSLCMNTGGGQFCTDLAIDNRNCGTCGLGCAPDSHCEAGLCAAGAPPAPVCTTPQTLCKDAVGGQFCTDLGYDARNCGQCGLTCPTDARCNAGVCMSSAALAPVTTACAAPTTICRDPGGKVYCAETATDTFNCGVCGAVCGTGTACAAGACVATVLL